MAETTLTALPQSPGAFTQSNWDSYSAMIAAQNANNVSLRAAVDAKATFPVVSSQIDPTLIQYATIPATRAQILALNSAGITLVAAQGAGTLVELISCTFEAVYGSAAYVGGGTIGVFYALSGSAASDTVAASFLTSLSVSAVQLFKGVVANVASTLCLNKALVLACGSADFTVGTGGSGILKVAYRVHSGL